MAEFKLPLAVGADPSLITPELLASLTDVEIIHEIQERKKALAAMVGWLYTSILQDEIALIQQDVERRGIVL